MAVPRGRGHSREKASVNLVGVFCEQVAVVVSGESAEVIPARQNVVRIARAINLERADAHRLAIFVNHVFGPRDLDRGLGRNHVITSDTEGRPAIVGRVHAEHDREGERVRETEDAADHLRSEGKQVGEEEQRKEQELFDVSHF